MNSYQHILVGLDLSNESQQVLSRAINLARKDNARLSLVHVIEPLGYAYGGDIPMDLTEVQGQLEKSSRDQLTDLARQHGIDDSQIHVLLGRPDVELRRYAEQNGVDLIVVGSHGRHGLQLLLGSTANATLHGAKCDVLAVRIRPE